MFLFVIFIFFNIISKKDHHIIMGRTGLHNSKSSLFIYPHLKNRGSNECSSSIESIKQVGERDKM